MEIKIQPEYECYSIWTKDRNGIFKNVSPKSISISDKLSAMIDKWEEKYEATYDKENPINSGFKDNDLAQQFENEGLRIWSMLRKEFPKDLVTYYSVIKNQFIDSVKPY